MSGVERTNQYGIVPTETKKCLTGLELLTRIMNGTLPAPPIQRTLDFRLVKVDRGSTVFAGIPRLDFYNPLDSVHGGYIAALEAVLGASNSLATVENRVRLGLENSWN